jgi:hypothetical protein
MLWAMIGHSDSPVVLGFLVATVITVAWFHFQVPMQIRRRRHSRGRPNVKRGGLFSRGQRSVVPFYWGMGSEGDPRLSIGVERGEPAGPPELVCS